MKAAFNFLLSAGAAAAIFLLPATAAASSYPCNGSPGERHVGMGGGTPGLAQFPICVAGAPASGAHVPSAEPMSPFDAELERMVRQVKLQQKLLAAQQAQHTALDDMMARDPAFKRIYMGAWDVFRADPKAKPGKTCTAAWKKQGQMVTISGPGPLYDGGLLTFWSPDIPQPADVQTITVTMKQSRYQAQTVKAVNYSMPGLGFGAVALTVPDIDKAIDTMLDVEQFELLIDGKTVSSIGWISGNGAREKLHKCIHPG